MRRLGTAVLVLAVVFGARLLSHRTVEANIELDFGAPAAQVRAANLVITDPSERVVRDLHLTYPHGAPPIDHRAVRLKSGRYAVGVRLEVDRAPERHFTRELDIEHEGTFRLDLSP